MVLFVNLRISLHFRNFENKYGLSNSCDLKKGMPVPGVLGVVGPLAMQAVVQKQPLEQGDEELNPYRMGQGKLGIARVK